MSKPKRSTDQPLHEFHAPIDLMMQVDSFL